MGKYTNPLSTKVEQKSNELYFFCAIINSAGIENSLEWVVCVQRTVESHVDGIGNGME